MKKRRNEKNTLKINTKNLFKNGFNLKNDIFINSYDFIDVDNSQKGFKQYLDIPIKDVRNIELENLKLYDKEYYNYHIEEKPLYKNIKRINMFSNWWSFGLKNKNKIKYLTITTPYIRDVNNIDLEISSLMHNHYHKIFGYKNDYNIDYQFYKIKDSEYFEFVPNKNYIEVKDTLELIKEWIEKNKNSKEYLFYKKLIIKENEYMLSLKEPIIVKSFYELNCYTLVVPFFYEKTFTYLFENFNSFKNVNNNSYLEEHINHYLIKNEDYKNFHKQFIPLKVKKFTKK